MNCSICGVKIGSEKSLFVVACVTVIIGILYELNEFIFINVLISEYSDFIISTQHVLSVVFNFTHELSY